MSIDIASIDMVSEVNMVSYLNDLSDICDKRAWVEHTRMNTRVPPAPYHRS